MQNWKAEWSRVTQRVYQCNSIYLIIMYPWHICPGSTKQLSYCPHRPSTVAREREIWIYISKCNAIQCQYPQHIPIFTYGSKRSNHTATAIVLKSTLLSDNCLIQFPYTLPNCMPYFKPSVNSANNNINSIYFFMFLYLASTLLLICYQKNLNTPVPYRTY